MFRTIKDFIRVWEDERAMTHAVLAAVPEVGKDQAVAEGHRTLARLGWHLTTTIQEMLGRVGLQFPNKVDEATVPATAAEIAQTYDTLSASVIPALGAWTDATLEQVDDMYGEQWPRGATLLALITHQAHHRGQMTVLLRQAGIVPPQTYGPVKESWADFGGEPPVV